MSNSKHIALSLALLAALVVAAQRAEASDNQWSDNLIPVLSADRGDDGRPPTTGPTNPGPSF